MGELRHVPRYLMDQVISVVGHDGEEHGADSTDISLLGMGFRITKPVAAALARRSDVVEQGERCSVMLRSPGTRGPARSFAVEGRIHHARRLSRDQYHVGIVFERMDEKQRDLLAELVAHVHRPR